MTVERIELLVADIDGCLVATGHVAYRLPHVLEVAELQRRSRFDPDVPPLTLLTGRPHSYVDALMQVLDIDAPAVFENGAGLALRRPYRARIDPAAARHRPALDALQSALLDGHEVVLQAGKTASLSVFPAASGSAGRASEADPGAAPGERAGTGGRRAPEAGHDGQAKVDEVLELVRGLRDRLDLDLVLDRSRDCVNVLAPGVDKGTGLAWLERETGVPATRMAGIGDSAGDAGWLAACALSCAPSPADADLRRSVSFAPDLPDIDALLALYREVIDRNRGLRERTGDLPHGRTTA